MSRALPEVTGMGHRPNALLAVAAAVLALMLVAAACSSDTSTDTSAAPTEEAATAEPTEACPIEGEKWEVAKLYIEHNATDEDTGVHGFFGGEAWRELCIWDPNGEQILFAEPLAQFKDLGISDLFWESREPPADEYSVDDLMAEFPEGEYVVGGTDFEGTPRVGAALFTHDIPVEPNITSPAIVEEDLADTVAVPPTGLVVAWDPVTETLAGDSRTVTGYEVIITAEKWKDPNGWSRPIYDVHVSAETNSLAVPDGFLQPGTLYELEVLVLEESGNQTISVGFFTTE